MGNEGTSHIIIFELMCTVLVYVLIYVTVDICVGAGNIYS